MAATLAGFNPALTTSASGLFSTTTAGYIQGHALPDPAIRYQLRSGIWSTANTIPGYGGIGISEATPVAGGDVLGPTITVATNVTGGATANSLTGFTVFDQAINLINNPQSPVPTAASGMGVNFFRLGSGITIPVACAPSLVSSIDGSIITTPVSWDFVGQQLVPYVAAYPSNVMTGSTYSSGNVTFTTTSAHGVAVGDVFAVTGSVPIGYNGVYTAAAGTTGSTLVASSVNGSLAAISTEGTLSAGGGALPVKVSSIVTNGLVVSYNPTTNFANYVPGVTALIQL